MVSFFITDTLENQLKIRDTIFPQMKICIFSYIEFYISYLEIRDPLKNIHELGGENLCF